MAINLYKLHFLSPIFFSEPNEKSFPPFQQNTNVEN